MKTLQKIFMAAVPKMQLDINVLSTPKKKRIKNGFALNAEWN